MRVNMTCRIRKRQWNEGGLEGLPFKLIIISLILALSIPIVVSNWMNYDREQTISFLVSELSYLETHVDQLYNGGLGQGNSRIVEINVRDGTFAKIERVEIGDEDLDTLKAKSVRWKLIGEDEQLYVVSKGIPMMAEDGGSFALKHGLNRIYIEVRRSEGTLFVEFGNC
jgi:hypothetical protein